MELIFVGSKPVKPECVTPCGSECPGYTPPCWTYCPTVGCTILMCPPIY